MQVTRPHDWPEDCGGSSFEGGGHSLVLRGSLPKGGVVIDVTRRSLATAQT